MHFPQGLPSIEGASPRHPGQSRLHASIFTGKFPEEHGVHESHQMGLSETLGLMKDVAGLTLSEELKKKGYQTIGLQANARPSP